MAIQIGQVAQRTGLSIDTIRFYEKQAIVPAPKRTSTGYRVYGERDVERLMFIGRAQGLGFSLQEIRELLLVESSDRSGCSHVRSLVAEKVMQVKEKIADLRRLESRLAKAQAQCNAALEAACDAACPVLEELEAGKKQRRRHEG
ncbi:MAG: heavy metal-responsive transcriptional regulator [Edaphobacter sp.]